LSLDKLEVALYQCNNSCPGLVGLRFSKALPIEAKLCLLDIYNDILGTGVVPQSWYRTRVVPIVKSNKDYLLLSLYRPISLWRKDVLCGVMLRKKLLLGFVLFITWNVFCVRGAECMTLIGYKGLSQGSALSPFL
jgi:hypothetical protein